MNLSKDKYFEVLIVLAVFILSLILFTPGNFGERFGGETWKAWEASKLLLDTGKFVTHTLGPLYYTLLILLNPFDYENSIILEYFITHIFCLYAFYKLLSLKNLKLLALLFPIAWIPFIAFIESPKYIFAMGFLCLHFSKMDDKKIFNQWFPPYLLCSILCNWGYVLFLGGHIFGKMITNFKERKINFKLDKSYYTIISFILIFLFVLTFINKLEKPYNNHFLTTYNNAPIPFTSPFQVAFFMAGNSKYAEREFEKSKLVETDWYFTHKYAFKDCENVFCAVTKSPKTVLLNLRSNIGYLCRNLTSNFFSFMISDFKFSHFLVFFIISILISLFGLIGLIFENKNKINLPLLSSIVIGGGGYIMGLALTFGNYRYAITLMPVSMLLITFSSIGAVHLINKYSFIKKKIELNKSNSTLVLFFLFLFVLFFNISFQRENLEKKEFINFIKKNKNYQNEHTVNYFKSYEQVFSKLNKNQKILSSEDNWLIGFADVDADKTFGMFFLPPFMPDNNSVNFFLDNLNVITVSNNLKSNKLSFSTNVNLRYELHLKSYLENNQDRWQKHEIPYYGSIYLNKQKQ